MGSGDIERRLAAILSADADTSRELEIGSELEIRVRVLLGSFRSEDISLEVLHGPLDTSGEIAGGEAIPLNFEAVEGNIALFHGGIPCRDAGRHGFAIRILPFRRELANKFETGLVTWWSGNTSTPSEVVAEKVG